MSDPEKNLMSYGLILPVGQSLGASGGDDG